MYRHSICRRAGRLAGDNIARFSSRNKEAENQRQHLHSFRRLLLGHRRVELLNTWEYSIDTKASYSPFGVNTLSVAHSSIV